MVFKFRDGQTLQQGHKVLRRFVAQIRVNRSGGSLRSRDAPCLIAREQPGRQWAAMFTIAMM
jgi:hypothetical protein